MTLTSHAKWPVRSINKTLNNPNRQGQQYQGESWSFLMFFEEVPKRATFTVPSRRQQVHHVVARNLAGPIDGLSVVLRLRMPIRSLIAPWNRHSQSRPFRQLLLAKGPTLDHFAQFASITFWISGCFSSVSFKASRVSLNCFFILAMISVHARGFHKALLPSFGSFSRS